MALSYVLTNMHRLFVADMHMYSRLGCRALNGSRYFNAGVLRVADHATVSSA
jgi:hypothetical protein